MLCSVGTNDMQQLVGVEKMYTSVHTIVNLSDVTQAEIMLRR